MRHPKSRSPKNIASCSVLLLLLAGCQATDSSSARDAVLVLDTSGPGRIALHWNAPTRNTDDTAIEDLAGYRIRYGTSSGVYTQSVEIGIATTTTIQNLTSGTIYFFTVSALNSSGEESDPSNEASKSAP